MLLVDTLSATNDYAVELALALAERVPLTVLTIATTALRDGPNMRVLPVFPRYGGTAPRWRKAWQALRGTLALTLALWRHRHGVVHVQFMRFPKIEWLVYYLLRPWLRCLVITVHNFLPHEARPWHQRMYRRWYRSAHRLHVLSAHIGQQLTTRMGIPATHIDVIPHGNYRRFVARHQPPAPLTTLGVPALAEPEQVVIGFFGLIRPYKGVLALARAFRRVASPQALLLVAGQVEASARDELDEVAKILAGDARYHLVPRFLAEHELAAVLERADIIAFPYTDISQSGALMLALTYGKAVVANDISGFREYLRDEETGLLCKTGEAEIFAATLTRLIDDGELRARLGTNARAAMETRYAWDTIAAAHIECYRRAAARA